MKLNCIVCVLDSQVAPLAGAWIETVGREVIVCAPRRRPPRGGVD